MHQYYTWNDGFGTGGYPISDAFTSATYNSTREIPYTMYDYVLRSKMQNSFIEIRNIINRLNDEEKESVLSALLKHFKR